MRETGEQNSESTVRHSAPVWCVVSLVFLCAPFSAFCHYAHVLPVPRCPSACAYEAGSLYNKISGIPETLVIRTEGPIDSV